MMLNHLPSESAARRQRRRISAARSRRRSDCDAARRRSISASSASRPACRSGATSRRRRVEKQHPAAAPPEHRLTSTIGCSTGDGPVRLELHPAVHFRSPRRARQHDRCRRRTPHAPCEQPLRAAPAPALPPLRLHAHGETARRFTVDGETDAERAATASRRAAATTRDGVAVEPRLFPRRSRRRARRDARRLDRELGHDRSADARRTRSRPSSSDGAARSQPPIRRPAGARRPSWCWRPTSSSSRRPAASRTPRAPAPPATRSRTVIAGYHWFTDWGRDTMISLEGLTLDTGRHAEAGYILRTFAHYVRDGLIPNLFPEGENEGLYHTADATLWFFHALDRYLRGHRRSADAAAAAADAASTSSTHHLAARGSASASIRRDGLLRQGAEGYQLTWMDAKVGDWVVTPRRGKAVEINALWYNALRCSTDWLRDATATATRTTCCRRTRTARTSRSTSASGIEERRLSLRRRRRRGRRRLRLPAQPDLRHLARPSRARRVALGAVLDVVDAATADAGRPALARAGPSPTTRRSTTATCGRATPPIIREPSGPG